MSDVLNIIRNGDFTFVIPKSGKCFKSKISKNDNALVLVLNKGFIESKDFEVCYYASKFFESYKDNYFVPVGNIEKIKLDKNNFVYRQRFYFKSLLSLLKLVKSFNGFIYIPSSFRVDSNSLVNVSDCLPFIERYAKIVKSSVDDWLTNVLKILLYETCLKLDMSEHINLDESVLVIKSGVVGYLDRAPLLCGSYDISKHTSSILRVEDFNNTSFYSSKCDINNYGFTDKNIKRDIKEGVFKS